MTRAKWPQSALVACVWLMLCPAPGGAAGGGDSPDTTATTVGEPIRAEGVKAVKGREGKEGKEAVEGRFFSASSDTIEGREFRARHAFSLDHFLELWPGFVVGRRGPIGADAEFSKYGIGRGRGVLYLGAVALNDPQDDRIPLGMVPTTGFEAMVATGVDKGFSPDAANIEGAYRIAEPAPPTDAPVAMFELSSGEHDLRQRRVRLSSIAGPVGIDFEFDELLNDGYVFDARGIVNADGGSSTRVQGGNVRGELPGGVGYVFSFRRFRHVFDGGLLNADAGKRRDGHVAVIRSSIEGVNLSVFERSHRASVPDSVSSNHTAGVLLSVPVVWRGVEFSLGAGYEDIRSRQRVGEETRSRLEKGHVGVAGNAGLPGGIVAALRTNATHYFDMSTGWGAGLRLVRALGSGNQALIEINRRFRMPNLGELFQPRHPLIMNPSVEIAGNRYVEEETALEGVAAWHTRVGGLANEIRATAIRVRDPISYEPVSGEAVLLGPQNGDPDDLLVLEDRARFRHTLLGTLVEIAGSIEYAPGDGRARFFSGVPEYRANACAAIGRDFFKKTSGVRVSAEYQHGGRRKAGSLDGLPAYDVVNLKLLLRIMDARVYVQWLNVMDEKYQTVWPYLMTPRTFVYGVEWTIFD